MSEGVQTKEISPGILLHKHHLPSTQPDVEAFYVFKVELQRLCNLEFTADFSGSENVELEGNKGLLSVTSLQPYSTNTIAKLNLKKDWKLKSKFRFTMRAAARDVQLKFIQNDIQRLKSEITSTAKNYFKIPFSVIAIGEGINILKKSKNTKYLDMEFLPNDNAIFSLNMDPSAFETVVQWRRPESFMENDSPKDGKKLVPNIQIFLDEIQPTDIKQGSLGNCWFMSALSSLAERPALVERLFITKEVNPFGIYRVRFCKNGEWVPVTIDDYFPCTAMGGPIFSRAVGTELWVLILEKAYAKLHGSYFLLKGGYANEAFIDLTGCPSNNYNFEDESVISMVKSGNFWKMLKESDEMGYLISGSTPGEDRWNEIDGPPDDENMKGLMPGHAYSILQVKEYKSLKLLNIRNPWGKFEWSGDWGDHSKLWTEEMKQAFNPILDDDDGSFWMCYDDFLKYFKSTNVCKARNFEEVRVKGKFIRMQVYFFYLIQDIDDPNIEVVQSKWYYSLEIEQPTKIIFGLHQEDERIEGVVLKRNYLDIGFVILKRLPDGNVELVSSRDLDFDRQVDMEILLSPGSYIILPRTTGCMLRRPPDALEESTRLFENDGLSKLLISIINDIFRKFDMLMTRELTHFEFKGFYECLNKSIEKKDFEKHILGRFNSTKKGITQLGFQQFWEDSIRTLGEEEIFLWLDLLGYDRELYSVRSRTFVLTMHSERELGLVVRDNIQTDLDERATLLIIEKYGKELESKGGVKTLYSLSSNVHAYSYAIQNDLNHAVEVTLDCSASKNMLFSTQNAYVKKRVEPKSLQFMLHAEAMPMAENFLRAAKCMWVAL